MVKNYYTILGLPEDATAEDIRDAYRSLAKKYHPDHYSGNRQMFLDIQEAYTILSALSKRRAYNKQFIEKQTDSYLKHNRCDLHIKPEFIFAEKKPIDIGNISLTQSLQTFSPSFDEIYDWFWENFENLNQPKSKTIQNLTIEVPITREQARFGGRARVLVPAKINCPICNGLGGIGPFGCARCGGEGVIIDEYPIEVSFPSGLVGDHTVLVSLEQFGIRNLYLAVHFRPTRAEDI